MPPRESSSRTKSSRSSRRSNRAHTSTAPASPPSRSRTRTRARARNDPPASSSHTHTRSTRHTDSTHHGSSSANTNTSAAASNLSPYQHSVLAAESRFSLTDQFATTRREFEFGFDDASSIFTRVTDAVESQVQPPSEEDDDDDGDDDDNDDEAAGRNVPQTHEKQDEDEEEEEHNYTETDYYDLLCLPRGPALTQEQIKSAFYRHFMLFYPEIHSSKHRAMAFIYFQRSQHAYEVLMDPQRRAAYDIYGEPDSPPTPADFHASYDTAVETTLRAILQQVAYESSEVGIRVDASKLYAQLQRGQVPGVSDVIAGIKPLDYALSQSLTVGLPLHKLLPLAPLRAVRKRVGDMASSFRKPHGGKEMQRAAHSEHTYYTAVPTVTVAASLYGLVEGLTQTNANSSLLTDRFQPLLPLTIPRHRILQLGELRCTPLIAVRVRQEIIHKARTADDPRWTKSAIELESDVLPDRALTARVSHTFILPRGSVPWNIEASATNGRAVTGGIPRLGVGIYRPLCGGTAFIRGDSGDWRFVNGATVCSFFGLFARESRKWFYADFQFPQKTTPSIEIGYKTTRCERWATTNYADIPRGESGVRGMDREASFAGSGSWAVSASAMPGDVFAGYLRYSRDIPYLAPAQTPSRVEVEVCGNPVAEHYFALRNLWQVGRFSRLGVEVGVSQYHFHISLYWSRLSHAISLPLLVSPRAQMHEKVVFWSAVAPFVTIAAFQLGARWLHSGRRKTKIANNDMAIQQYVVKKRTEAEEIEYLMEDYVVDRQKREAKKGGLVILSAKYGVKDGDGVAAAWAGQEVADVKVAVAALVDTDGRLEIPEGVRKSHIPGFWDPMPLQEKVLHVRYMYRGEESVAEVRDREGLILPLL